MTSDHKNFSYPVLNPTRMDLGGISILLLSIRRLSCKKMNCSSSWVLNPLVEFCFFEKLSQVWWDMLTTQCFTKVRQRSLQAFAAHGDSINSQPIFTHFSADLSPKFYPNSQPVISNVSGLSDSAFHWPIVRYGFNIWFNYTVIEICCCVVKLLSFGSHRAALRPVPEVLWQRKLSMALFKQTNCSEIFAGGKTGGP